MWAERCAAAERAVRTRSVRRLWALPGTALGVNSWPPTVAHRLFLGWNYWWQAHLLDCLVDAQQRDPRPERTDLIDRVIRGIRLANGWRWTNSYFDDMAWLALALGRVDATTGGDHTGAIRRLTGELLAAWSPAAGGGIPWRRGDAFKNTPANGPAAIVLARTGHLDRAAATADWIDSRLRDPATGLIWDGLRPAPDGGTQFDTAIWDYCQGVVLGAELELLQRIPDAHRQSLGRIQRLLGAIGAHLSLDGVLTGHAGGDSGLFPGILARYLALIAVRLPDTDPVATAIRQDAGALILRSAEAAWTNASHTAGLPTFGPAWSQPARAPRPGTAERDLSVQLSGWMLMEAAFAVDAARTVDGRLG